MSRREHLSYWSIVGRQVTRDRVAMFGLWCIGFLLIAAVYAPLVSSDRPFIYTEDGTSTSPWLRDLFDHNEVRQAVDLFFNLIMVMSVPVVAAYFGCRAWCRRRGTWRLSTQLAFAGATTAIFLWVFAGIAVSDATANHGFMRVVLAPGIALRSSRPVVDYHEKAATARAEGREVSAVFAPVPYHYDKTRPREQGLGPDFFFGEVRSDLGAVGHHPLGTDGGGKDVFSRLLYGTRISMTVGVVAVGIYVTIGIILGSLAGYFGGWVDIAISRLIEIFISFPFVFFVLTVVAVFDSRSIFLVMAAIGVVAWPGVARLVRGQFLTQRNLEYVDAARALGLPQKRVIFRHVLPNALTPVLVTATFGIASAILLEATISFLGLGDPTASSWGSLLNQGRHNTQMEWLILTPGLAIFFTVTVFNMFGEGLRDALDPKLRR